MNRSYRTIVIASAISMADPQSNTLHAASLSNAASEPLQQTPETERPINAKGAVILTVILGAITAWAYRTNSRNAAQATSAVSNVRWIQTEPGTVEISYDLASSAWQQMKITIEGTDSGRKLEIKSVRGDVGLVKVGSGKVIVWDAAGDYSEADFPDLRFLVKARKP